MDKFLTVVLVLLSVIAMSWVLTIGAIKLITMCFGIKFSLAVATGIWLILGLIGGLLKGRK